MNIGLVVAVVSAIAILIIFLLIMSVVWESYTSRLLAIDKLDDMLKERIERKKETNET